MIILNESDRSLISSALRLAADKYAENAASLREPKFGDGRLADQFDSQSIDAKRLAQLIEDCESVSIEEYQEEERDRPNGYPMGTIGAETR